MSMRGLGTEKRRSIYPYLKFKAIDFFLCLIVLYSIIMVHNFARFKLLIMYDGTNYQGWQIQKDGRTVQGIIENAFRDLSEFDRKIRVNGSGRTDAGVHVRTSRPH